MDKDYRARGRGMAILHVLDRPRRSDKIRRRSKIRPIGSWVARFVRSKIRRATHSREIARSGAVPRSARFLVILAPGGPRCARLRARATSAVQEVGRFILSSKHRSVKCAAPCAARAPAPTVEGKRICESIFRDLDCTCTRPVGVLIPQKRFLAMSTLLRLLFLSTSASGFTIVQTPTNAVRLQTFAPVREPGTTRDFAPTLPRPDTLPETWVVPDTFTFPTKKTKEPNVYRLTLFKSSKHKAEYIVAALIETIGIEATKANEIAKQAQTLGFAVVGDYVQEVAETYAATLKERYGLVVDVSVVR